MLKIRLARTGKHKSPMFRIVLTESTKPVKSGYQDVLGFFDPINHKVNVDVQKAKDLIAKGAKPSERVAKILFNQSNDEFFKKYFTISNSIRKPKKQDEKK